MKNKNKKLTLPAILLASTMGSGVNAAPIDITETYNSNAAGIDILNNTGTTLDTFSFDLSNYISNNHDYTIYMTFGWDEVGDLTDTVHEFIPNYFGTPVTNGNNIGAVINYDVTSPSSMFYGMDMSSLPLINLANAVTGYGSGVFPIGTSNLSLPDYNQKVSPVSIPSSALLFAPAFLFGAGIRRKIQNKEKNN